MRSPDLISEQEIDEIMPVGASPLGWGYIPIVETLAPLTSVHGSSQIRDAKVSTVGMYPEPSGEAPTWYDFINFLLTCQIR